MLRTACGFFRVASESMYSGCRLERTLGDVTLLTRLFRQPQQVWLRRAIFQVHLWTGLALGLYVVVVSLTGSVLVYRLDLDPLLASPRATLNERATPMTADEIRAAAARAYPGWAIVSVNEGRYRARGGGGRGGYRRPPDPTASVILERDGQQKDRLFDPYSGADLGDSLTRGQRALLWVVSLHDDLLLGRPTGTTVNGALGLAFTLVVLTGTVVWWPGIARWKRSLGVRLSGGWRRVNWDIHSALGFWLLAFMAMWGISGWYIGMPDPLTTLVEWLSDPDGPPGARPGDRFLEWLARLHFGRWRDPTWGPWLKAVWAIAGLAPAVMFGTGVVMWWSRVVRRRRARNEVAVEPV